jgi:hypothetical protein
MRRFKSRLAFLLVMASMPAQLLAGQASACVEKTAAETQITASSHDHALTEQGDTCCREEGLPDEESPGQQSAPDCMVSAPCASTSALPPADLSPINDVSIQLERVLLVSDPLEVTLGPESPPPRH